MDGLQTNSADEAGGLDLLLQVRAPQLRQSLTAALRDAVRTGRLAPGTRLPASRALAADLGIARSTVTESYGELVAEGWLTAQQGSGTRVAIRSPVTAVRPIAAAAAGRERSQEGLLPGASDFAEFPVQRWLSAARRALHAAPYSSFGYGDPAGHPQLREALTEYLGRVRGVSTDPEHIIVSSGFHHGLSLVARTLVAGGTTAVAVEGYGLDLYRQLLGSEGLGTPTLPVDEHGARTADLARVAAGAVLLTPAHQFPTGTALSAERRRVALDWARTSGGYVLEDDYDGEFRYDRAPIGALQSLDPQRVVYFGTASKSLAPALRIAWIVAPETLRPGILGAKGPVETVSVADQLTLAEFIRSGDFDAHVRSRRAGYRRRRGQLIAALLEHAPGVSVAGMPAGLQALLELPDGTEEAAVAAARRRGLVVLGLAGFRHEDADPASDRRAGLVVNFSSISASAWDQALGLLIGALAEATRS